MGTLKYVFTKVTSTLMLHFAAIKVKKHLWWELDVLTFQCQVNCWRVDLWTIKGMSPGSSTITLFQIPAHHLIFLFGLFSLLQSLVPGYKLTKSDHKRTLNYSIISYNNIITNETEKDIKINGEWNQSVIGWTLYPLSYGYHIWWTGHLDTWLCILQVQWRLTKAKHYITHIMQAHW